MYSKNDITLEQWQEWSKYLLNNDKKDINDADLPSLFNIFFGIKKEEYDKISITEFEDKISKLLYVLNSEPDKIHQTLKYKGIEYGLINFDEIIVSQYEAMEFFLQNADYVRLMSCLYLPIKRKEGNQYKLKKFKGSHEDFKDISYRYIESCIAFFLTLLKIYTTHSQPSTHNDNNTI